MYMQLEKDESIIVAREIVKKNGLGGKEGGRESEREREGEGERGEERRGERGGRGKPSLVLTLLFHREACPQHSCRSQGTRFLGKVWSQEAPTHAICKRKLLVNQKSQSLW